MILTYKIKHGKDFLEELNKARLPGIPAVYVDPYNTFKECSRCGQIGDRSGKSFKCLSCGHFDINASCNIALRPVFEEGTDQLYVDRDAYQGNTGSPEEGTLGTIATLEPHML